MLSQLGIILRSHLIKVGKIYIVTHGDDEESPFVIHDVTKEAKGRAKWVNDHIWDLNRMQRYYLYPEVDGADDQKLRMNSGSTYEGNVEPREDIHVTKHGLKIPSDVDSYTTFASKMQMSELAFRQVLMRNI